MFRAEARRKQCSELRLTRNLPGLLGSELIVPISSVQAVVHHKNFQKVPLASSKCFFKQIKVDKWHFLKMGSRDFKNSFYFGIV